MSGAYKRVTMFGTLLGIDPEPYVEQGEYTRVLSALDRHE